MITKKRNFRLGKTYVELYGEKRAKEIIKKKSNSYSGHIVTQETRDKISKANKGTKPWITGRHRTEETKRKTGAANSKALKGRTLKDRGHKDNCKCSFCKAGRGEYKKQNNPNWVEEKQDSYDYKFDSNLKEQIRKRDNYTCKICLITEEEHILIAGENLSVHHIDYNKMNSEEDNLISLCRQCHMRTNYNREYWIEYFKEKVTK